MDFNRFIFPAPTPSYTASSLDKILWVPRTRFFSMKSLVKLQDSYANYYSTPRNSSRSPSMSKQNNSYIPCHYQTTSEGYKNLIIFFHGNAEDIGIASSFTKKLAIGLKANVLSVEYPGYGVYKGSPDAKTILEDAEIVYDFLTNEVGLNPQNIIIFGRSIGSGPATHLAANRKPGALILMSPYTSIKAAVAGIAGNLVSSLFAERFCNIDEMEKVECPCFLIHGKKDRIIPWEHSQDLFSKCKAPIAFNLSETMSHNTFKLITDIISPIKKFFKQLGFKINKGTICFPDYAHQLPSKFENCQNFEIASTIVDSIIFDSSRKTSAVE